MKDRVYIIDRQSEIKIPTGTRMLIRRCCKAVLNNEKFDTDAEVTVSLVNNNEIKQLNNDYRNINSKTDVLSFAMGVDGNFDVNHESGAVILGDIVISLEKAIEQANRYGHDIQRELAFLTVHGMYHLLGYDHEKGGLDAAKMREKEEFTLTQLGLPRTTAFQMER